MSVISIHGNDSVKDLIDRIASVQDAKGCWNVLNPSDPHYQDLNYYVPNYKSTLWTLILLADCKANPADQRFFRPLDTIAHFLYREKSFSHSLFERKHDLPSVLF